MASRAHLDRLKALRSQLGSLLDEELVPGRINAASGDLPGSWTPRMDILETDEAYEILAELPGVRREDIELRVVDSQLELLGIRHAPSAAGSFHRMEGRYGPFHRIVNLGAEADENGIAARLSEGVLSVRVEKRGAADKRREISVTWGDENV